MYAYRKNEKKTIRNAAFFLCYIWYEHENKVLVFQYQIYSDMIILYVEKLVLSHWEIFEEVFESLVNSRWQAVNEFVREEFSFGYLQPEVEQPYLTNSTEDAPLELTTLLCVLGYIFSLYGINNYVRSNNLIWWRL